MGEAVRRAHERGAALVGSSAGAMVLAAATYLPERGTSAPALGLVPGAAVLPHYSRVRGDWLRALPAGLLVLGIPEATGLLLTTGESPHAGAVLGVGTVQRLHAEGPPPAGDGPSKS